MAKLFSKLFSVSVLVAVGGLAACSKASEPPPSTVSVEALGRLDATALAKFRGENSWESENEQNFRDAPDAFLRPMGLEGRRDFQIVGARRFFQGSVGRQEVGMIAATRVDGKASAITVHAVGPIMGTPEALLGLMAPLNLIDLAPVRDLYVKALAAMPNGGFSGDVAGYRVRSEQRGDGAELLSLIAVVPVSPPPQLPPMALEPLAPPPPKLTKAEKQAYDIWAKAFADIRSQGGCREAFIPGKLVGKIGPNSYEWIYFGSCGRGECPHFVLKTVKTEFEGTGRFQLCVRRGYEVVGVETNDGFKKAFPAFTEDPT